MENQNNNLSNAHKWSKSYAPKGEKRGKYIKRKKNIKKPRAITFGGRIALGPTI